MRLGVGHTVTVIRPTTLHKLKASRMCIVFPGTPMLVDTRAGWRLVVTFEGVRYWGNREAFLPLSKWARHALLA